MTSVSTRFWGQPSDTKWPFMARRAAEPSRTGPRPRTRARARPTTAGAPGDAHSVFIIIDKLLETGRAPWKARGMKIGIVGGLDRGAPDLALAARAEGHELEFHRGVMSGPHADSLRALVDRVDAVIILTEINSHAAVQLARRQARLRHKPTPILRRLRPKLLAAVLPE